MTTELESQPSLQYSNTPPLLSSTPVPVRPLLPAGELATFNLQPATSAPEPPTLDIRPETLHFKPRRRRGPQSKIAQLPADQLNLVNQLLDEDKTYEEVVQEMAKHGVSLNIDNVYSWFNGPYQDYLAALDWQDELQRLRDQACPFGHDQGNVRFQEGVVQIGLTQIFRAIKEDRFKDDPANTLRLFNSLARLSREALVIRKYADQQAKEKVQELRKLDPNRKINDVENNAMHDRADDFFGWKSADRIKREMAQSQVLQPDLSRRSSERRAEGMPDLPPASTVPANPSVGNKLVADLGTQVAVEPFPLAISHLQSKFDGQTGSVQKSKIDQERCHECRALLPPLLASGERPSPHCNKCGTSLRPPGSLIEYCPKCRCVLQELTATGSRPTPNCLNCNKPLPPPPPQGDSLSLGRGSG